MSTYEPTERDQHLSILQLQHTLYLLASEAEEQINYLERNGYDPSIDELVLNLEVHYIPGETCVFHRLLTREQLSALAAIAAKIGDMDQDPKYIWDTIDLRLDGWSEVRALSRNALETFGFSWGPDIRQRLVATWPTEWQ